MTENDTSRRDPEAESGKMKDFIAKLMLESFGDDDFPEFAAKRRKEEDVIDRSKKLRECPVPDDPFSQYGGLGLVIEDTGQLPFRLSVTVKARFQKLFSGFEVRNASNECTFREKVLEYKKSFVPFFNLLVDTEAVVELTLIKEYDRLGKLTVTDFKLLEIQEGLEKYGFRGNQKNIKPLQDSILSRLLRAVDAPPVALTAKMKVTGEKKLRFLFEACRDTYPPHIVRWAEEELATLDHPTMDSDDKRHALTALTYILNIDWSVRPINLPTPGEVKRILDERFYGMEPVKQRIVQIIAQIRHTGSYPHWGILLAGPVGTGKSSIANAVAEIFGLPRVSFDMSSINDGTALTGSSRVYHNARPGLFLDGLLSAGQVNCTCIINELDKAYGRQEETPPSDVLLTMLDGLGFVDVFIETSVPTVPGIFFIATANDTSKIDKPLLDRFLRVDIPGYTSAEKHVILEQYTMPKTLQRMNLENGEVTLSTDAVDLICSEYATEPGVRDVEQYLEKIVGSYILGLEQGESGTVTYTREDVKRILGPSKALSRNFMSRPGLVISAFHHEGVVRTFPVEAIVIPGKGEFETLNIRNEMTRDYCRAAYLCLRKSATNIDFSKLNVSVYIPQQIPEGECNFVGVAVYAAIASAIMKDATFDAHSAFIGGVDFYSNMFLDAYDVTPYLYALAEHGIRTVYAPLGSSQLIYGPYPGGIEIVESGNIETLLSTAVSNSTI